MCTRPHQRAAAGTCRSLALSSAASALFSRPAPYHPQHPPFHTELASLKSVLPPVHPTRHARCPAAPTCCAQPLPSCPYLLRATTPRCSHAPPLMPRAAARAAPPQGWSSRPSPPVARPQPAGRFGAPPTPQPPLHHSSAQPHHPSPIRPVPPHLPARRRAGERAAAAPAAGQQRTARTDRAAETCRRSGCGCDCGGSTAAAATGPDEAGRERWAGQ
jgi:hypothetical protein